MPASAANSALVKRYCLTCHNSRAKAGNLALDALDVANPGADAPTWERAARKLRAGVMPPVGMPRPDEATYDGFIAWLEQELDRAAAQQANPGRTDALHRLNRSEYRNAIRDLLALDVDVADLLPADDASYGFDNVASGLRLSQSLLEGYLAAAKKISRVAVGTPPPAPDSRTYNIADSIQQHDRIDGLPFGTRGGTLVRHFFPSDGEYELRAEASTTGMSSAQSDELVFLLDGEVVKQFPVEVKQRADFAIGAEKLASNILDVRVTVTAGPHDVSATFLRQPNSIVERLREPLPNPEFGDQEGGPLGPRATLKALRIVGPVSVSGPGDTPSRRRLFVCRPQRLDDEDACAEKILLQLARRAFRRPVDTGDIGELLTFFRRGREEDGSFDRGIEFALWRLLVSPEFLYRVELDPPQTAHSTAKMPGVYEISNLELASRLSFFLWSSIPDDELLSIAERGQLSEPAELERQVRRMVNDPRSVALTENFAGQWLQLRNMDRVKPEHPYIRAFDDSLRAAMRRETELLFDSVVREDRSAIDIINADYTFLNERLARHYGIWDVQGSHFRRVALPADSPRRGILGHGSILTITSQAIRTSPVVRGKWILMNILGTPPPDPPPNVPALEEKRTPERQLSMRERMAQHRRNPSCSGCHSLIDPAGFALENFDAIGRWRLFDESFNKVDTSGVLPDGSKFGSFAEFRAALVRRPERFAMTATERLLIYALGRGLEYYDMPAVRKIVRESAPDYRMQSIITGVAKSYPFLMRRRAEQPVQTAARQ